MKYMMRLKNEWLIQNGTCTLHFCVSELLMPNSEAAFCDSDTTFNCLETLPFTWARTVLFPIFTSTTVCASNNGKPTLTPNLEFNRSRSCWLSSNTSYLQKKGSAGRWYETKTDGKTKKNAC